MVTLNKVNIQKTKCRRYFVIYYIYKGLIIIYKEFVQINKRQRTAVIEKQGRS